MCSPGKGNNLFLPNKDKYYNPSQWSLYNEIGNFFPTKNEKKENEGKAFYEKFGKWLQVSIFNHAALPISNMCASFMKSIKLPCKHCQQCTITSQHVGVGVNTILQ